MELKKEKMGKMGFLGNLFDATSPIYLLVQLRITKVVDFSPTINNGVKDPTDI